MSFNLLKKAPVPSLKYFKKMPLLYSIGIIIILIIIVFIFFKNSGNSFEYDIARIDTIVEKISVTGKIAASKKTDLGFEKGGIVSKINFKVGDQIKSGDIVLALDSTDTLAQLRSAEANLSAERIRLSELIKGLRPEELIVEDSKLKSAEVSYEDARISVINALHDSYIKTENAITNYSDIFFNNPQTVVPKIIVRTENYTQENSINDSRLIVGENLSVWKSILDGMTISSDPIQYLDKVHKYLGNIKSFYSQLSSIASSLSVGNSGLSQSSIDTYNLSLNNAMTSFNSAISSLATAEATYKSALSALTLARDQFALKKAGSSEETVGFQRAKVDQINANMLSAKNDFSKKSLISPIDGIVTKIEPEIGEFVSAGQIVATIMSDVFKIEVNVPESDIAKILINNLASVTLDAYDSSIIFDAHVISIDPAETIIEGVPTYKVTLQFDKNDDRLRSGMTANIDIITNKKDNAVVVPFRAVFERNDRKYIRIIDNTKSNNYSEILVQTGIKGDNGKIEIVSGLDENTKVITLIK